MKSLRAFCIAASVALISVMAGGCAPSEEEGSETGKPVIKFEGKPDPKVVGKWATEDKRIKYEMKADGKYTYDAVANTPQGEMKTNYESEWTVNGDKMLFKDTQGNVIAYTYEITGDTFTVTSVGTMKNKTVFKRQ